MYLFISAERSNDYFINSMKDYCVSSNGKHTWIYLPETQCVPGETLSRRIGRYINSADLIFMDVTPQEYKIETNGTTESRWFTNPGVVVEYSVAIALGRVEDMKVYCLASADKLHQILRERIVDTYPQGDKPAFLRYIDDIVAQRENDSLQLLRQSRVAASFHSLYPEL
jgi:hypothetical protein